MGCARIASRRLGDSRRRRRFAGPPWVATALALAVAGVAWSGGAIAEPRDSGSRAGGNAAIHYLTMGLLLGSDEMGSLRSFSEGMAAPVWPRLAEFRKRFPADSQIIAEAVYGSRLSRCDFGVHYEDGPGALLPHLGVMRSTSRLLALDARALLEEGKPAEAVARLAAGYRMAEHVSQDRLLISSLVSANMFAISDQMADYFESRGVIDEQGRAALRAALSHFDDADPFRIRASLAMEERIAIRWLRERADSPEGRQEIVKTAGLESAAGEAADAIRQAAASGVNLDSYIDLLQRAHRQALARWDEGDQAEAGLATLESQIEQGVFGPLTQKFMPALSRTLRSDSRAREMLRARLASLGAPQANREER